MPDLDAAVRLVGAHPRVRAVTATGDLVGADWAVGGQPNAPTGLEVRARVDEADAELTGAMARAAELAERLAAARQTARDRSADVETALAARQAADRSRSAVATELAGLGAAARSAAAEAERHQAARVRAEQSLEQAQTALTSLEQRLAEAEAAPVEEAPAEEAAAEEAPAEAAAGEAEAPADAERG